MDLLKGLFGDPIDLVKRVITHVGKSQADDVLEDLFNKRMNAASRVELGKKLEAAGKDLQAGRVAKASDTLADVIGEIKF